jgi:AraC family transcriptional regulator
MTGATRDRRGTRADYANRINRVMDYIDAHLEEDLSLDRLAHIACFSRFHFHRIFQSVTGERLAAFIQRIRLERAAALLRDSHGNTITGIALMCGFASSASFANAFKRHFGTSASGFRHGPRAVPEKRYVVVPDEDRDSLHMSIERKQGKLSYRVRGNGYQRCVDIVELPPWNVAYIRYTGPYKGDTRLFGRLWRKLAIWAAPRGLLDRPGAVYLTLCHDDPEITLEEKLRVSVCIGVDETTVTSGEVGKMRLPGGTYARCRFHLGSKDYPKAWGWMYGTWLPLSGYLPDDRPAFEWFPPCQAQKSDGKIDIDICVPVKTGLR